MSIPPAEAVIPSEEIPVEVQTVINNVFQRFKQAKNIQVRPFLEDIVTFLSIVGAYYFVSLSFQRERDIETWTGIQFTNSRTEAVLLLIFAIYLISLKIIHFVAYKYGTAPPKKIIPDNWEEMEETEEQAPESVQDPNQQKVLPPDSYSLMIEELLQYSIYGFVLMISTTSYTFISAFNKKNNLVQIQQINYLILWYVTANIFYSVGKLFGKITGIRTFHHFGLTIGIIIMLMELGLAHGLNTFIFI